MRITRKKTFQPVTIVLETEYEVGSILQCLHAIQELECRRGPFCSPLVEEDATQSKLRYELQEALKCR